METKISVKNITIDGMKVFADVTVVDGITEETKTYHCNTNSEGYGLWMNGQQTDGTCQFSLSGSKSAIRSKLRRRFSD